MDWDDWFPDAWDRNKIADRVIRLDLVTATTAQELIDSVYIALCHPDTRTVMAWRLEEDQDKYLKRMALRETLKQAPKYAGLDIVTSQLTNVEQLVLEYMRLATGSIADRRRHVSASLRKEENEDLSPSEVNAIWLDVKYIYLLVANTYLRVPLVDTERFLNITHSDAAASHRRAQERLEADPDFCQRVTNILATMRNAENAAIVTQHNAGDVSGNDENDVYDEGAL